MQIITGLNFWLLFDLNTFPTVSNNNTLSLRNTMTYALNVYLLYLRSHLYNVFCFIEILSGHPLYCIYFLLNQKRFVWSRPTWRHASFISSPRLTTTALDWSLSVKIAPIFKLILHPLLPYNLTQFLLILSIKWAQTNHPMFYNHIYRIVLWSS